jgi:hypothetical protein
VNECIKDNITGIASDAISDAKKRSEACFVHYVSERRSENALNGIEGIKV